MVPGIRGRGTTQSISIYPTNKKEVWQLNGFIAFITDHYWIIGTILPGISLKLLGAIKKGLLYVMSLL